MLRALTTRLSVALVGLALSSGVLHATNKLLLSPTSITVNCNPHVTGQIGIPVTVKPVTALTGTSTLAVTLPSTFSGGLVVTPPSVTTLSTSNQTAGIVYTVSLPNGCSGVTNNATPSFSFLAAGTTDASETVTTTVTSGASLTLSPSSPASFTCSLQSGPTPVQVTVKPNGITLTGTQTIAVTLPGSISGGITVTAPSVTSLSTSNQTAGIVYTISSLSSCSGLTNGGTPSFSFIAGGVTDASLTVDTAVTSSTELVVTPSAITPTCSTQSGPGPVTVTVKPALPLTGSNSISVTLPNSFGGGITVTPPSVTTLSTSNQGVGLQYIVSQAAGCVGVTNAGTAGTFSFLAGGQSDATLNVTTTLANTVSGLQVSNATVTVNCTLAAPGVAQSVAVTSTATGGTPFTVVTTGLPTGVTVAPTTGGTASTTAMNYSIQAASGCGGNSVGTTTTGNLTLHDSPGPDKVISVALQVTPSSPLIANPNPISLSYVKGSGTPATQAVAVTSTIAPGAFFQVDTTSLPIWLTVDSVSGTVPRTLNFSSTTICDSLAPGTYSSNVRLKVSTYGDLSIPFTILITNSAPKLTVSPGATQSLTWALGQTVPTGSITLFSSDSPISYSLTTGGALAPTVASNLVSGLAYSFGTEIPVSFNSTVFASAQPGDILTGTVTVTWGPTSQITICTFNITVLSAQATLSAISPASLPTAAAGQTFPMVLTGTGFVPSTNASLKTTVGIVSNGVLVQDTNIASSVVNTSNIAVTITVPAVTDTYLPFTAGGSVTIGVCNPQGTSCSVPTATMTFSIGNGPIVQVVTSASSYQEVAPGTQQSIAPYDMISIFGTNFCSATAPACASNVLMPGVLSQSTMVYQNWLATDPTGPTQRQLTVSFCPTGQTTGCTNAPLLYATNTQINAIVPGELSTGTIDIIVGYGYGAIGQSTEVSSPAFTVKVVAADPGIFAIGADGQGSGAILDGNYELVDASNPAAMRQTGTDSSSVQVYMTGLGVPLSSATNTGGTKTYPTDCISPAVYLSALNTATSSSLGSVDGAVIQDSLLATGNLPPCITTAPTVTIGGQTVTASYAAWVGNSVAGLYQVNFQLPATGATDGFVDVNGVSHTTITEATELPITVTVGTATSQTGVSMWVAPRLEMAAPTTITGTVGVAWGSTNNAVVATEGTSPYTYTVTSGVLPTGLSLSASSGAITGTPAAGRSGSYTLTVTATDSANVPVTGTVSFTLTIAGGLVLSASPSTYTGTVVTSSTPVTTISATGGNYPYTYSFDSGFSAPAGMSIGTSSGIIAVNSQTPGGPYTVVVDAVDTNGWTGSISLPVTLHLSVTATPGSGLTTNSPTSFTGTAGTAYTVALSSTGGTAYTYAISGTPPTGFSISGSTLEISTGASSGSHSVTITSTETTTGATGTITLTITL